MALLNLLELKKRFRDPDGVERVILDIPAFTLDEKKQVALAGQSGSGKSTLLHLIAGILNPDSGRILFNGQEVTQLAEPERDRWRAQSLGYIFQTFQLLPGFTCMENVMLAMAFAGSVDRAQAKTWLTRVCLEHRLEHFPRQLSTGQQQRVAIARALANRPKLILADEPTGNLDAKNAQEVLRLMRETCSEVGAALLLVSHDRDVLAQFETTVELSALNQAASPQTA